MSFQHGLDSPDQTGLHPGCSRASLGASTAGGRGSPALAKAPPRPTVASSLEAGQALEPAGSRANQDNRRIAWLDLARGVAVVLVVAFHSALLATQYGVEGSKGWVIHSWFSGIRLPVLFLISGMLAAPMLAKRWPVVLSRRVLPLLYLAALWNGLRHLFFAAAGPALPEALISHPLDGWEYLRGLYDPAMEHWYIWALAIYYLGAKAFGQWSRPALLVVLASISIWQCSFRELPFSLAHSNALRFAFFFAAGAWGADFWKANMSRLAAWVATFALPPFLLLHWGNAAPHAGLGLTVFLELVFGALAGSAGAVLLARNGVASALLCRLGRNTLPIYLGHVFPLAALIRTWAAFGIDQTGFHLLLTPAAVVVGVGAPLAMRFVVCKLKMAWLYSMPWADLVGAAPGDLRGQSTAPAEPSRAAA